ncbi:MAG TPA: hypothetical protein VF861_00880 [Telluria sp.]
MKKIIAISAILSLVSAQALAQSTVTDQTPAQPQAAPAAVVAESAPAPAQTGFMSRVNGTTGLSNGALVAIGVAVAAVAVAASDSGSTTAHHGATTHH